MRSTGRDQGRVLLPTHQRLGWCMVWHQLGRWLLIARRDHPERSTRNLQNNRLQLEPPSLPTHRGTRRRLVSYPQRPRNHVLVAMQSLELPSPLRKRTWRIGLAWKLLLLPNSTNLPRGVPRWFDRQHRLRPFGAPRLPFGLCLQLRWRGGSPQLPDRHQLWHHLLPHLSGGFWYQRSQWYHAIIIFFDK